MVQHGSTVRRSSLGAIVEPPMASVLGLPSHLAPPNEDLGPRRSLAAPFNQETKISGSMRGRHGMFTERTPLTDAEGPETDELYGIEDTAIRHGFVRKVFSILLVQLVTTVLVGGVVMKMALPISKANPALTMALMMGSLVIAIACMCIFACCPRTMQETPTNYILLGAFTLAEAVLVGFISASYTQASVLIVLATTCVVVMGLILFACQTTYDITGFLPYVLVACLALFGFGMILTLSVFFGALTTSSPVFQTMHLVYSICGVLIFSCFIVLDTQLIVGGKHSKYRFGVDDYCMAAINLYMDIVQLFLYLLQLLGERR
eukprot:s3143_g2.t2